MAKIRAKLTRKEIKLLARSVEALGWRETVRRLEAVQRYRR